MTELPRHLVTQLEVQEFLFAEADVLDERRFGAWLDMLADDIVYRVPVRSTLYRSTIEAEFEPPEGLHIFDDNKQTLTMRVGKVMAPTAWSETPASRTRRIISNVRVIEDDGETLVVKSNFYIFKSRLERNLNIYVGSRRDALRRHEGSFKIVSRLVHLDETVLAANNISIFL